MGLPKLLVLLAVALFFAVVQSASPGGFNTLVILENQGYKKSHSAFFASLTEKGHKLTFGSSGASAPKITEYEEFLYDNIIFFAPTASEFGSELSTLQILRFMEKGGNVLVAGSPTAGAAVRDLAYEVGIEFSENGLVIDHFNVGDQDDGTHTLVKSTNLLKSKVIFRDAVQKPVLFKGLAHKLNSDNPLVFSLLGGNPTSFSGQPGVRASAPQVLGKETGLVSALQARNNARITISGSIDLFSDEFFNDKSADNKAFSEAVAAWTFRQRGVLREVSRFHHKKGETQIPDHYIVNDQIVYSVRIEEWNGDSWVPFTANDMQWEAKMLDPYIRTTLISDGKGNFTKEVTLPDVYGVYTFLIEYNRIGYTFFHTSDVVPIRPLRHNQYPRFIGAAYPYYSSAFAMTVGFFLFGAIFLYSREPQKVKTS